jgi:glycosyltransferase involved in cell wall biosynthesis
MKTRFSIITPTYNRGYTIWKTIISIQKQLYPYWELLILDDGSTDNTKQVVAEFQKDPRIRYIQLPHKGGHYARNAGLKESTGDIITYVDSDDTVYEHFLSTALEYFQKFPRKIFAIPNYNRRLEFYDENYKLVDFAQATSSQKKEIEVFDFFNWNVKTCGTGIFHKRKIITDGIRWDPKIKRFQDWDFILQLGTKYPHGFMHIPFVLFEYLQKYGAIEAMCAKATYKDWADGFDAVFQKHKNDPLMQKQTWHPAKIEKYLRLHELEKQGKVIPANYKDFPDLYERIKKK